MCAIANCTAHDLFLLGDNSYTHGMGYNKTLKILSVIWTQFKTVATVCVHILLP